ncbi:MAG: tyrosinase family protein [Planctomyces sp.]|nr:tyrosinase family protein [Planctomyces sp.]
MSTTSRRTFLGWAAGAATATVLGGRTSHAAASSGVRVRKDVSELSASHPDIEAYKEAVRRMKALPANNPRSWLAQSRIHGMLGGGFGNCRHGSWHFLPWHRAYLHYFEEICRELSGKPDFALPYWDWSRTQSIPAHFFGAGNPLDNPSATGNVGRQRGPMETFSQQNLDEFVGLNVISAILGNPDFETFAGGAVANINARGTQGRLESVPHNFVHRWVGGDMATGGSPYDSIFWLHHCNVDRLWSEWSARHPNSTPNDPLWLNGDYGGHFVDGEGMLVGSIQVRNLLDTAALGYRYDTRSEAIAVAPQPLNLKIAALTAAAPAASDGGLTFALAPNEEERAELAKVGEGALSAPSVRIRLSGIEVPKNQDVSLRVFVNCELLTESTPIDDPSYVGSCTFFSHGDHGHGDDSHGDGTASFFLNASPAFAKLYGDRPLKEDEPLKVSIVAVPLFPDDAERTWSGSVQELSPKQVQIDIITGS